ncbi:UDP-N-acetylmuramoyl-tripeptide--D-alanyl-D-alanine ligase [Ammoniphilus resinae]|uniref:UDP-N-acetylmuramoyl-tripeptide--D-alanyl-D-alanine ligase n=1 Tax=Ammoniphilus resinae TaxID=861532 RepID=A0ABS4GK60_9BACL|nr:UDP-N-acetylmuramoyl-tripeptide--D-alanyl-D-alanine ligase [Ammoniphilus resinae]MBP1930522.1 UDP-N-acetylmuramoyl-tripeptide--D-alanyl-D-alanine ligase [Ammoniphilus resinae]
MLTLAEICQATGGRLVAGQPSLKIDTFHFDTRMLSSQSMFIALTGGARDGHDFLQTAKENGAIAALISDITQIPQQEGMAYVVVEDTAMGFANIAKFYRSKLQIPIIAVTGSNGKTTTKDMIAHILESKKKTFKTYKNYNNHLGVPLSLLQIGPDHEIAVLEMGMNHAGEIDFLASIAKPDISVIVNVTDAHIEYLGSKENIAKAKGELLPHTSPNGFAILNGDNPYVVNLRDLYPGKAYFFRTGESADIYASEIQTTDRGTLYKVHIGKSSFTCTIPMFGLHNVSNTLPGIFIANQLGYNSEEIANSLTTLTISPMRFELVKHSGQTVMINDAYNASPTSMKSSITTFSGILPHLRKVLVLGDMFELGEQSIDFHRGVGEHINTLSNSFQMVVTVGDHSRYISELVGVPARHFEKKEQAAEFLQQFLTPEYALLFKGSRGMKLEEIVSSLTN